MRIVSLVPSLTSTLCSAGLRKNLIGCTPFCVLPPGLRKETTNVRGPKDPDLSLIASLKPTHIIVNKEENKPEHIEACQKMAPTLVTFPKGPTDVAPMLKDMQAFLAHDFSELIANVTKGLASLKAIKPATPKTYLYLIWKDPYMAASCDTYISESLSLFGLENAIKANEPRYPELSLESMASYNPDMILFASEPYPFRWRDVTAFAEQWLGKDEPQLAKIDGRLTQWYGDLTAELVNHQFQDLVQWPKDSL